MAWSLSNRWKKFRNLNFHSSAVNLSQEVKKTEPPKPEDMHDVSVRPFDRILLVWSGKFKNSKEVPDRISRSVLSKCHSLCRVKICNYMMALTVIAAFFYAMSGKSDAQKGLTMAEMNRQWHKEYNKKMEEKQNS